MFVQHSTHVKVTKYHKTGKEEYENGITAKEIRRNSITTAYGFKEIFMNGMFYQFIKQYIIFIFFCHRYFASNRACDDPTVNVISKKESEMGRLDYGCIARKINDNLIVPIRLNENFVLHNLTK